MRMRHIDLLDKNSEQHSIKWNHLVLLLRDGSAFSSLMAHQAIKSIASEQTVRVVLRFNQNLNCSVAAALLHAPHQDTENQRPNRSV